MTFIKRYWRIVFPLFFIALIWYFSSQDANASDGVSMGWAEFLRLPNGATRKLAHMTLFACLGFSFSYFLKGLNPSKFPNVITTISAFIVCFCYGTIDEVHQIFTPGRSSEISDIFIDTLGGCIGIAAFIAIFCFWNRFRLRKKSK